MKSQRAPFILYIWLALLMGITLGCQSTEERQRSKELSTLRLHLEVNPDGSDRSHPVPVYRENPIYLNVERTPFLDEASIAEAKVVEVLGGFAIAVQFDEHGKLVLEATSAGHRGRRIALFSQFADQARWLAAPTITRKISDGSLIFTPDVSREEAERIVRGLNNVGAQLRRSSFLGLSSPR